MHVYRSAGHRFQPRKAAMPPPKRVRFKLYTDDVDATNVSPAPKAPAVPYATKAKCAPPPPPRHPRCIAACAVVSLVVMLATFAAVAFLWNTTAEDKINDACDDAGVDVHVGSIHGAFPFKFTAETVDVYSFVTLYGVHVRYGGTYNPFHLLRQTGHLFRVDATARVTLLGHDATLAVRAVDVERRDEGGWHVAGLVDVGGYEVAVDVLLGGTEAESATMTLRCTALDVVATLTRTSVTVRYAHRDVITVAMTPDRDDDGMRPIRAMLGSVLNARGRIDTRDGGVRLREVQYSLFDHPMHSLVDDLVMTPNDPTSPDEPGTKTIAAVDSMVTVMKPFAHDDADRRQLADDDTMPGFEHRLVAFDGHVLSVTPPLSTPLGDLRSAYVDWDLRELHVDVGTMPVSMNARTSVAGHPQLEMNYGPLHAALHEASASVDVRGGYYGMFKCVRAQAHLDFDAPHLLVGDHVEARLPSGDRLEVNGAYDFRANKMTASVQFEG